MWQYYKTTRPGLVQVLGPDLYNGTSTDLTEFKTFTGATYPLLLNGAIGTIETTNLAVAYGQFDNYVVINKVGIVRYNAFDRWPHGNRYHLDEIRGCVDSLVNSTVGVELPAVSRGLSLLASPNPTRGATTVELSNPGVDAVSVSVVVFDLAGREVVRLGDQSIPAGVTRFHWDGKGAAGSKVQPGIFLVQAQVGSTQLVKRVVLIP